MKTQAKENTVPDRYRHSDNRRRLSVRNVQAIRRNRLNLSVTELAARYGVCYNTIRQVLNNQTWKGVQ